MDEFFDHTRCESTLERAEDEFTEAAVQEVLNECIASC